MLKKPIVGGIVLLFIVSSLIPIVSSDMSNFNNTIYVDDIPGSGPDNPPEDYTSIQYAIENATDGDTVYVYNGTYYEGDILIGFKSIQLIGEDKSGTVVIAKGGSEEYDANVNATIVVSNYDLIKEFTFDNYLLFVVGNNSTISNNILDSSCMILWNENNYISNNIIFGNDDGFGICLDYPGCNISGNIISENLYGIVENYGDHIISNNTFSKNEYGLVMYPFYECYIFKSRSGNVTVRSNTFIDNDCGLFLFRYLSKMESWNSITKNNFIRNSVHATFFIWPAPKGIPSFSEGRVNEVEGIDIFHRWYNNYWDDWNGNGPKPVNGKITFIFKPDFMNLFMPIPIPIFGGIPFYNFDWHPATEPYNIPVLEVS